MAEFRPKSQKAFLKKHKKTISIVFGLWLMVNGFAFFPLELRSIMPFNGLATLIMMFYTLGITGNLYRSANDHSIPRIFMFAFVMNGLGLAIRIALEYGEASMVRALTPTNVLVFILILPSVFAVGAVTKEIVFVKMDEK